MWEGRSEHDWGRTALVAYLIAEVNRDRKRRPRPFTPDDFNPHARPRVRKGAIQATPQLLAALFCNGKERR